jgi:hypothetical protein
MITKMNLARLEGEGFQYIVGVKHRQDEICNMLLSEKVLKRIIPTTKLNIIYY